jgi:hypothetical protein
MSPATIFQVHLVLGYVPWLLFLGAYALPRFKVMDWVEAQRAIATLHSFRFFGLALLVPRVVGPNLPAGFATFAAYGDFATGVLAMLALHREDTSGVLAVRRCLQCRGGSRHPHRLLPRQPARSSGAGGGVGRHIRDPDHLRAGADDHARRRLLSTGATSAQGGASSHGRCGRVLKSDWTRNMVAGEPATPRRYAAFYFDDLSFCLDAMHSILPIKRGCDVALAALRAAGPARRTLSARHLRFTDRERHGSLRCQQQEGEGLLQVQLDSGFRVAQVTDRDVLPDA